MQMETEITVLVKTDYETLKKELIKNGFQEKEQYIINDTYLVNENVLKANFGIYLKEI